MLFVWFAYAIKCETRYWVLKLNKVYYTAGEALGDLYEREITAERWFEDVYEMKLTLNVESNEGSTSKTLTLSEGEFDFLQKTPIQCFLKLDSEDPFWIFELKYTETTYNTHYNSSPPQCIDQCNVMLSDGNVDKPFVIGIKKYSFIESYNMKFEWVLESITPPDESQKLSLGGTSAITVPQDGKNYSVVAVRKDKAQPLHTFFTEVDSEIRSRKSFGLYENVYPSSPFRNFRFKVKKITLEQGFEEVDNYCDYDNVEVSCSISDANTNTQQISESDLSRGFIFNTHENEGKVEKTFSMKQGSRFTLRVRRIAKICDGEEQQEPTTHPFGDDIVISYSELCAKALLDEPIKIDCKNTKCKIEFELSGDGNSTLLANVDVPDALLDLYLAENIHTVADHDKLILLKQDPGGINSEFLELGVTLNISSCVSANKLCMRFYNLDPLLLFDRAGNTIPYTKETAGYCIVVRDYITATFRRSSLTSSRSIIFTCEDRDVDNGVLMPTATPIPVVENNWRCYLSNSSKDITILVFVILGTVVLSVAVCFIAFVVHKKCKAKKSESSSLEEKP